MDLRGLPKGRYTVRVVFTTTPGKRIVERRRYRTCTPNPKRKARSRSAPAVLYAAGRDAQDYLFYCRMLGART